MATSSIMKSVNVKNKKNVRRLLNALESTTTEKGKKVVISKSVTELSAESVSKIFGDKE